jgi:hypothetical protein
MKLQEKNSRRKFLKNSAAIIAGISTVTQHVLGRGFLAPINRLTKGDADPLHSFLKPSQRIA